MFHRNIYYYRKYFFRYPQKLLVCIIVALIFSVLYVLTVRTNSSYYRKEERVFSRSEIIVKVLENTTKITPTNKHCSFHSCINAFNCGKNGKPFIKIFIYPFVDYFTSENEPVVRSLSKEFYLILKSIQESDYYTSNPNEACIFLPSFDTLSYINFQSNALSRALTALAHWNNGENHMFFNFLPEKKSSRLPLSTGRAIIAGSGFNSWTYRQGFDISLPPYVPIDNHGRINKRIWFLTSLQLNLHPFFKEKLRNMQETYSGLIVLHSCPNLNKTLRCFENKHFTVMDVLQKSVFCLIIRGSHLIQPLLIKTMAAGCIPIIVANNLILPFHEVIDWKKASLSVMEDDLQFVIDLVKSISEKHIIEMSKQCQWLYWKYFSSIESVTNTTLKILNQRFFPETALFYNDWNMRPELVSGHSPLFSNVMSQAQSFTAVILTYDRLESLFFIIEHLDSVRSLSEILIIWNNQKKAPPSMNYFPNISKPIKVIKTKINKLSNRFLPFDEIHTEAVLSLDDDITMLTIDELEFGFEVWKEFPDRLVGFPSRTHLWDNISSSWRYESEWTNEISMVLTGAAFYHKYWHYMYSISMPQEIRHWVDNRMNCEDIAMNFLIANTTNQAPIKVAPRKKFKCPECLNTEMLSLDLIHMQERTKCINKFTELFGRMPLKKVEFRADPVLFKVNYADDLKKYKDIGSL